MRGSTACVLATARRSATAELDGMLGASSGSVSPHLGGFFFFLSVPVHVADKPGAEFSQKNQNSPAEATLAGSRKAAVGEAAVSRRDVEPLMQQAGARYVWAYVLGKE